MRLLLTSDLHSNRRWFKWLETEAGNYDLISIAGDLLDAFSKVPMEEQADTCISFLKRLAAKTWVAVCSGNHDPLQLASTITWLRLLIPPEPIMSTAWLTELGVQNLITDGKTAMVHDELIVTTLPYSCPRKEKYRLIERGENLKAVYDRPWLVVAHDPADFDLLRYGGPSEEQADEDTEEEELEEDFDPSYDADPNLGQYPNYIHYGHYHDVHTSERSSGDTLLLNAGQTASDMPSHIILDTKTGKRVWIRD